MPTFRERQAHIDLWVREFGPRRRDSIRTSEIDAVLSRWLTEGLAASTVKHRRGALLHLWNRLDGPDAPNPVRRSIIPAEPEPEPRGLPYEVVEQILGAMPDRGQCLRGKARDVISKTKARLALMAYTGLPPASIMRLRPSDVRWDAAAVFVLGRRKGRGTKGRMMPLTTRGLQALRDFSEADCWGRFSTSSVWQSFQRACRQVGLSGLRPYDLRHSFGTAVYAATGDERAAQQLLGHASRATTDRYTLAAVPERLKVAVGQVDQVQQATKKVAVPGGSTRPVLVSSRKQTTRP
jgi:integrase